MVRWGPNTFVCTRIPLSQPPSSDRTACRNHDQVGRANIIISTTKHTRKYSHHTHTTHTSVFKVRTRACSVSSACARVHKLCVEFVHNVDIHRVCLFCCLREQRNRRIVSLSSEFSLCDCLSEKECVADRFSSSHHSSNSSDEKNHRRDIILCECGAPEAKRIDLSHVEDDEYSTSRCVCG